MAPVLVGSFKLFVDRNASIQVYKVLQEDPLEAVAAASSNNDI